MTFFQLWCLEKCRLAIHPLTTQVLDSIEHKQAVTKIMISNKFALGPQRQRVTSKLSHTTDDFSSPHKSLVKHPAHHDIQQRNRMEATQILIIDNDADARLLVQKTLERLRVKILTASDGETGLQQFADNRPNLVILDVNLPNRDGWSVCREILHRADIPIIFLTALHEEKYLIYGFECGAVDYLTKPFRPGELLARARVALRHAHRSGSDSVHTTGFKDGYLEVNLDDKQIFVLGQRIPLTKTEYRVLAFLVSNSPRIVSFPQLLKHVWGPEYQDEIHYVHVYLSRLRKKIEADPKTPRYLHTEHGMGCRFAGPANH